MSAKLARKPDNQAAHSVEWAHPISMKLPFVFPPPLSTRETTRVFGWDRLRAKEGKGVGSLAVKTDQPLKLIIWKSTTKSVYILFEFHFALNLRQIQTVMGG
ncbi:MAG TPA: hypothetical protein V6D19_04295 [Stenomitos sp.]